MKKIAILLVVCALGLSGCNSESQTLEAETIAVQDTYTIGTTATEIFLTEEIVEEKETTAETKSFDYDIVSGFYVNIANPYEQWQFFDNGGFYYAGQELTYEVTRENYQIYLKISDGREYTVEKGRNNQLTLISENDEIVELYEEGSDEVMEAREQQRLYSAKADLFEKYPDEYGWLKECDYGDIPYLADEEYIEKSLAEGVFLVSTPEQLASFNYIVNTSLYGQMLFMQLQNDIDLDGYSWVPMGWYGGETDLPFMCFVDGNGYTIKNMTINCYDDSAGFIGWETGCGVYNITFENAEVNGGSMVGIITGQAIGGWYENCHVSGRVNGYSAGSMLGHDASCRITDCTADVIVNGEPFDFLTWNDKEKSEIVIENPVEITIDDTYTVTRPEVEGYTNLGWMIYKDGVQMLHRNAENELSYQYFVKDPGKYEIYLTAWVEGQYMPISNIIEYTIE